MITMFSVPPLEKNDKVSFDMTQVGYLLTIAMIIYRHKHSNS